MDPLRESKRIIYIYSVSGYVFCFFGLHFILFESVWFRAGPCSAPPEGQGLFSASSPPVYMGPLTNVFHLEHKWMDSKWLLVFLVLMRWGPFRASCPIYGTAAVPYVPGTVPVQHGTEV